MLPDLFNPKNLVVLGVSHDPKKVGYICLKNIKNSGYSGKVFPINPSGGEILGFPVYKDISKVNIVPDLCIISLPLDICLVELNKAALAGWKNFVIFTAGFKESGPDGAQKELQLLTLAKKYRLNILGPNCFGFVNTSYPINATFGQGIKNSGMLNFLSQSGAIASSIFDWADETDIGFNEFITLGNKTVLDECDILEYWMNLALDPKNPLRNPVGMYLESINNGQRFLSLISKIVKQVPVFILKPGKSELGKKAMQSHTGSLAGSDRILEAALNQFGVIRCNTLSEMFDLIMAISWSKPPKDNNGVILSNAGGPGVISADLISEYALNLVEFDETTKKILYQHLPRSASVVNPIDVLGDALADRYSQSLDIVLRNPAVSYVLALLTPQVMTEVNKTALAIHYASQKGDVPIYATFIGGKQILKGNKTLNTYKIPHFDFPENAIKTFSKYYTWFTKKNSVQAYKYTPVVFKGGNTKILSFDELQTIVKRYSLPVPKTIEILAEKTLLEVQESLGYPAVLKISDTATLHKTEKNGVILNIRDKTELHNKYRELHENFPTSRVFAQEQIISGVEVIVGVKRDRNFGHVLMLGAGGILTELIDDTNLYVLPISEHDILPFIKRAKVFKLLNGYRNLPKANIQALENLIIQLNKIVMEIPEIREFEINPLIIGEKKASAVDIKCILEV